MSLATGDLTTLASVKAYLTNPPSDQVLSGLITRISRLIQAELNRGLLVPRFYSEQYDGTGTAQLVLPHYPLIGTAANPGLTLTIGGTSIPLAPQSNSSSSFNTPCGFRVPTWNGLPPGNPPIVELIGYRFWHGRQNIVVTYTAGYQVVNEAWVCAASITPQTPFGIWATDQGVFDITSNVALTAVTGIPATGQYTPPNPNAATPVLNYVFNAAQVGHNIQLNYGYIPAELEQATIELIAERSVYRNRVGVRSQMLASQESMSYDLSGIPKYIYEMINPYVSVLPPPMGAAL